ncbi:hypothetical protein LGL85_10870 [Yersinia ruckeri]|nr:hypothetical protein LGL91_09825 [Yersinia ruckeri]UIN15784.1 hypothetical protein LGL85_10870 [Yersinia ruckeri]
MYRPEFTSGKELDGSVGRFCDFDCQSGE